MRLFIDGYSVAVPDKGYDSVHMYLITLCEKVSYMSLNQLAYRRYKVTEDTNLGNLVNLLSSVYKG